MTNSRPNRVKQKKVQRINTTADFKIVQNQDIGRAPARPWLKGERQDRELPGANRPGGSLAPS